MKVMSTALDCVIIFIKIVNFDKFYSFSKDTHVPVYALLVTKLSSTDNIT